MSLCAVAKGERGWHIRFSCYLKAESWVKWLLWFHFSVNSVHGQVDLPLLLLQRNITPLHMLKHSKNAKYSMRNNIYIQDTYYILYMDVEIHTFPKCAPVSFDASVCDDNGITLQASMQKRDYHT